MALLVILPLLSGAGFARMSSAAAAANCLISGSTIAEHRVDLEAWRRDVLTFYLSLVIVAFLAGRLRNRMQRRAIATTRSITDLFRVP
ncbi:hypothetical protein [Caballeronia arationis]|nr:hypothetical protein [Caballeronia arationis]